MKKRGLPVAAAVAVSAFILLGGTFAWRSVLQNITNDFAYAPAQIRLIKLAEGTGLRLPGAVFDLYSQGDQLLGRYITDENGEIALNGLNENERYYLKEVKAPAGYELNELSANTPLFSPGGSDLVVYNKAKLATLTVEKVIAEKDLAGGDYAPTQEDKAYPFAFELQIGTDTPARYPYSILDSQGVQIADYTYTENGQTLAVAGQGELGQTGAVYLRHGERLVVRDIPALTYYSVREKNYLVQEFNGQDLGGDHGCSDPENPKHLKEIGTASGWAVSGSNTVGNLPEEGARAVFENTRVPQGWPITMSSLAVVDRIIANPEDIDPQKGFSVTAVIGSDPGQQFYYEIIHTGPIKEVLPGYDADFDYYNRNDPGMPGGTPETAQAGQNAGLRGNNTPPGGAGRASAAGGRPLHYPSDAERWPQKDGTPQPLKLSAGNTITVELHHESALIIYGIPVGTHYSVRQIDYQNLDGYIIDSTIKTEGTILPDLEVLPDHDTADSRLLRVRADIYNYFVLPVKKTLTIQKRWQHGANPTAQRPIDTTVRVIDVDTGVMYDSRTLVAADEWAASVELPKYDPVSGKLIDYGLVEASVPDYVMSDLTETENGFSLTNTYAPAAIQPAVRKVIGGEGFPEETFRFSLKALSAGAPLPAGGAELALTGEGIGFFGQIVFREAGVYEYQITELPGAASGYTYDQTAYALTVTVTDEGGKLHAEARYTTRQIGGKALAAALPLPFKNVYAAAETASLALKKLVAGPTADPNRMFGFRVDLGGKSYLVNLKHGGSYTFEDIPVGTPYTIVENDYTAEGYITTAKGSAGTVPAGGAEAVFTNTKSPIEGKASLVITKRVEGPGAEEEKEFRFEVTLGTEKQIIYLKHGESHIFENLPVGTFFSVAENNYVSEGYTTASTGATGTLGQEGAVAAFVNTRRELPSELGDLAITKTVNDPQKDPAQRFGFTVLLGGAEYRLRLAHGETYRFTDIPAGTPYQIIEEDPVPLGYAASAVGSTGTILPGENACVFTNTKAAPEPGETGRLVLTKRVQGAFLDSTRRFRFTVTIGGVEQVVYLRHGESKVFSGLPAGTSYSVAEDDYTAEGYVTTSTGAAGTITPQGATAAFVNEYTSEVPPRPGEDAVQISGVKTWVHGSNPEEKRPQEITVYAMNGSVIAAKKVVTAKDNWSYAFNLPKYDQAGGEIAYTINEEAVPNYIKSVSGYDLTNTFTKGSSPQTGDSEFLWLWLVLLLVGLYGLWHTLFDWGKKPFARKDRKKPDR